MAIVIISTIFTLAGLWGMHAAYHNGVTDGYGYSQEPSCPGYAKAGRYLKSHMAYRWPELNETEARSYASFRILGKDHAK